VLHSLIDSTTCGSVLARVPPCCQVLVKDCYFTSSQAAELVASFSYGEDKVDAAVKVGRTRWRRC
jgi:hypothetical protein